MRLIISALLLLTSTQAVAENPFIEGFPDVPFVDGVLSIEGEPIFFDTPSGTIAEVSLKIEGNTDKVLVNYIESLAALGWKCSKSPQEMRCEREKNRLVFKSPNPQLKNGTLILRLVPLH